MQKPSVSPKRHIHNPKVHPHDLKVRGDLQIFIDDVERMESYLLMPQLILILLYLRREIFGMPKAEPRDA